MLYEQVLTVADEVELIWRHKLTLSSWLFLMNRGVLVVGVIDLALAFAGTVVSASLSEILDAQDTYVLCITDVCTRHSLFDLCSNICLNCRCAGDRVVDAVYVLLPMVVNTGGSAYHCIRSPRLTPQ